MQQPKKNTQQARKQSSQQDEDLEDIEEAEDFKKLISGIFDMLTNQGSSVWNNSKTLSTLQKIKVQTRRERAREAVEAKSPFYGKLLGINDYQLKAPSSHIQRD